MVGGEGYHRGDAGEGRWGCHVAVLPSSTGQPDLSLTSKGLPFYDGVTSQAAVNTNPHYKGMLTRFLEILSLSSSLVTV